MPACADISAYLGSGEWGVENPYFPLPKSAFTLIELLVYIAIMGFIIVVAGRAFSDATGMRLRSQNMLNSAEEAGRVSAILKEDISQMGAKSWEVPNSSNWGTPNESGGNTFETVNEVYNNFANGDYSSYILTKETDNFDKLAFKKVFYDASGVCGDVMEVEWYVRAADSVLIRKCKWSNIAKCQNSARDNNACLNEQEVEIARNVSSFKFLPSKSSVSNVLFPANSSKAFALVKTSGTAVAFPNANGTRQTLCKFTQNPDPPSSPPAATNFYLAPYGQQQCEEFAFLAAEEYSIDFELPCSNRACANSSSPCNTGGGPENFNPMTLFQPQNDHLSIGLRGTNKGPPINGVPDFLFYPPYDMSGKKAWHFEFSVPSNITACIGITAAFYSQAAAGHLDIENFTVSRKTDNVYRFDRNEPNYNPTENSTSTIPNRASVKAFELTLGINKKGEINRSVTVIPVPNNGILPGVI